MISARASGSTTSRATCWTRGTLAALHRRVVGHRTHLEPHDLRPRDQEQRRLRRRHPQQAEGGQVGRGAVLRARHRRPHPGGRSLPPGARAHPTAWTAGCRSRSRRCSPTTRPRTLAAAKDLHARAGAAQPLHQDPGHRGGPPRHRGGDLRRRADQRDAAVLARAVRRRRRGVPARHRAPHRGRTDPGRRLGRLGVHQPLGRRGGRQGAARAAQPARHRHRAAHLQGVSRPAASPRWQRVYERRRPAAAAALGQHRHQGSRRPPTSSTSRRWPRRSRSTPCPRPR